MLPKSMRLYILGDAHEVIPVADTIEWGHWFEKAERHVAKTTVGPYWVSTVFLGIDSGLWDSKTPLVFETMVFKGDETDLDMERYSTWDEAVAGHEAMVQKFTTRFTNEQTNQKET